LSVVIGIEAVRVLFGTALGLEEILSFLLAREVKAVTIPRISALPGAAARPERLFTSLSVVIGIEAVRVLFGTALRLEEILSLFLAIEI
jgi:hypothetical protein